MQREMIQANPRWQKKHPWHGCVLVEGDADTTGFGGLKVAQVICFLSFKYLGVLYGFKVYQLFYVNKYIDYHAHKNVF